MFRFDNHKYKEHLREKKKKKSTNNPKTFLDFQTALISLVSRHESYHIFIYALFDSTVVKKVAMYLQVVIKDHPFTGGQKYSRKVYLDNTCIFLYFSR